MATPRKKSRRFALSNRTAKAKSPAKRRAEPPAPTRQLGYAVVGLGHIAQAAVLPAFAHAKENSRLVALVSGDPEKQTKLAKRYGVTKVFAYEDFEACLRDPEVEAVYIALPNTMHAEFTERAAKEGVHVLCEKPMATSVEECGRMIAACDDANVKLMIAYRLHFEEANLRAVEAVQRGAIGQPRVFNSTFTFQVADDNIRTTRELGGGVLWDIGIYCINAARMLFRAEPIEVFAYTQLGQDTRFLETEEGASVLLRFPGDRVASFSVSFGAVANAKYQLLGTEGRLEVDNAYEYEGEIELRITDQKGKTKTHKVERRDQFAPELVYFSDCVLNERRPEPNGNEGLADVRIIEAAYESAQTGRPIKLEPVEKRTRPSVKQELHKPAVEEPELVNVDPPSKD